MRVKSEELRVELAGASKTTPLLALYRLSTLLYVLRIFRNIDVKDHLFEFKVGVVFSSEKKNIVVCEVVNS